MNFFIFVSVSLQEALLEAIDEVENPKSCWFISASIIHEADSVRRKIAVNLIVKFKVKHGFIKRISNREVEVIILYKTKDEAFSGGRNVLSYLKKKWGVTMFKAEHSVDSLYLSYLNKPFSLLEYSANKNAKTGVDNSDEDLKSALERSGYASHSSSGMSVRSLGVLVNQVVNIQKTSKRLNHYIK